MARIFAVRAAIALEAPFPLKPVHTMPVAAFIVPAVVLSAGLSILGRYVAPRPLLIYVFKPLTTVLILVLALLPGMHLSDAYTRAILLGLLLSLVGDIWLVLPGDRFIQGLGSFLLAHICYAFAFRAGASSPGFIWVAIALAAIGSVVLAYLWNGLSSALKGAVSAYVLAILLMAALAVGRALSVPSAGSLSAAAGALLFVVSDATLAIDRFRKPFHLVHIVVLGTYFAAQLLIAASVARSSIVE
jgi:uncharacterized membrane protein YhhN